MTQKMRTVATFSLPAGIASAIAAEAERRDSTPSLILEDLLLKYLSGYVSRSIEATLSQGGKA